MENTGGENLRYLTRRNVVLLPIVAVVLLTTMLSTGCWDNAKKSAAQKAAENVASNRDVFEPKNDIEGRNYNWREEISDDPTTILWCTTAWPIPSSPLITIPIAGKLTSGNKRPFETSYVDNGDGDEYFPEIPGPDGFFGTSGEYRYGFGPAGKSQYYDFYGMPVFCTTEPLVYQRESTTIVMETDGDLLNAQKEAQAALAQGNTQEAERILREAIKNAQR